MFVQDNDPNRRPNPEAPQPPPPQYATFAPPSPEPASSEEDALPKPRLKRRSLLHEIFDTVLLVVAIYTLVHLIMPRYIVEGESMDPNFETGEWIMVSRLTYFFGDPQRGDVVILDFNDPHEKDLIKRVVGLPGEHVEIREGQLIINGEVIYEPYLTHTLPPNISREWQLGEEEYFVLGDNRSNSRDSRAFGPIPREDIVGRAWVIYWPPERWGVVPTWNYDATPTPEPTIDPAQITPTATPYEVGPPPAP